MADPDFQGGRAGHPDPEIRGGPVSKKIFSALQASVWSKSKGPPPLPWIRHWCVCKAFSYCFYVTHHLEGKNDHNDEDLLVSSCQILSQDFVALILFVSF